MVGKVIAALVPAFATGAWFEGGVAGAAGGVVAVTAAGLTVTVTLALDEAPSLSVTVRLKTYVPSTKLSAVVLEEFALDIE